MSKAPNVYSTEWPNQPPNAPLRESREPLPVAHELAPLPQPSGRVLHELLAVLRGGQDQPDQRDGEEERERRQDEGSHAVACDRRWFTATPPLRRPRPSGLVLIVLPHDRLVGLADGAARSAVLRVLQADEELRMAPSKRPTSGYEPLGDVPERGRC